MQEDPKTVLRGMLTQVGKGDNFVGHGERGEGKYFQRLSGKRKMRPCVVVRVLQRLFNMPRTFANLGSHTFVHFRRPDYFFILRVKFTNNQIKCITVQYNLQTFSLVCLCDLV
jgi:hypothetical protein